MNVKRLIIHDNVLTLQSQSPGNPAKTQWEVDIDCGCEGVTARNSHSHNSN